jgi:hypothetical protein
VTGYVDGRFGPHHPLTRGQLASIIDRALTAAGVELPSGRSGFADVDGSVHREAIERLAAAGVLRGRTATQFDPQASVTRAQTASILDRASTAFLTAYPAVTGPRFADTIGPPHQASVDRLAAAGIVRGTAPDGANFAPARPIRRDQTASLVVRWLEDQADRAG